MKISVIMPTFNDRESIEQTLNSLINQTYHDWELIIVDDGSTDGTKEAIANYKLINDKNDQIKYYYQSNCDQLKAILTGTKYITGDYVHVLHSDDLLASPYVFDKCIEYFKRHSNVDSIIADLIVIDDKSNVTGKQKVMQYQRRKKIPPTQLLWLGRNLYIDVAFHKKDVFLNEVNKNYLTWNMPFWLCVDGDTKMLNVKKVNFPFIKYRVHSGNYINNEMGKLNVINGELRTATTLMKYYSLPLYKLQYIVFRLFNKLSLAQYFVPFYFNKQTKNKAVIVDFIVKKRYGKNYKDNLFLNSIVKFYMCNNDRQIRFNNIPSDDEIYFGNMMRLFNKDLLSNNLSDFYLNILKEMELGFEQILVKNLDEKRKMSYIVKFLCIDKFVTIKIDGI